MSDEQFYKEEGTYNQNVWAPWNGYGEFGEIYSDGVKARTGVSPDRIWIIYAFLKHALQACSQSCEVWECGVYQGGTAKVIAETVKRTRVVPIRLFDTFVGMPKCDPNHDNHREGDFSDTSLAVVKKALEDYGFVEYHKGWIPDTFVSVPKDGIVFAHVDVDIYQSVLDCCKHIWPALISGGVIVFDDYGFPMTRGAREAVDVYFADKKGFPVCLPTGQAVVYKCD